MKSLLRISLALFFAITTLTPAVAQEPESTPLRPVLSAWTIGIGSSHVADTYLSPLKYKGWDASIDYERMQASAWWSHKWSLYLKIGGDLLRDENPARNAAMWGLQLHASWGMIRRWSLPWGLTAGVGPAIRAEGGCLYNARNGNNPASAKGAVTLDAVGFVARRCMVGKLPLTLRYQPTLPVIGGFFSPHYDELYYEMYLGNHSGLVHPAWWGNRFKLDQLITVDMHFGSTALRLGYECNWMSSKVCNLTTRIIDHRFIIGVTLDWVSRSTASKRRVINSF